LTAGKHSQEAHLRVVLHHDGRYQLLFFADLIGFDLYAGPHGVQNLLRSSWHATGQVHTHTPAGRQVGPPRVMPENFVGKAKLYSGGYTGSDWSYKPKPNSSHRQTLVLERHAIERGLTIDLWAVETNRLDLIAEVLGQYSGSRGVELVSHATTDWTRPQLVAVAGTLALAAWAALQKSEDTGKRV
jgi:hypothetical protein